MSTTSAGAGALAKGARTLAGGADRPWRPAPRRPARGGGTLVTGLDRLLAGGSRLTSGLRKAQAGGSRLARSLRQRRRVGARLQRAAAPPATPRP